MAFFLRKAFKAGPIRFNLSKGGLGLSAGITGARLGLNSRGTPYVHGGRHGVYYRKNLNTRSRPAGRGGVAASGEAGVAGISGVAGTSGVSSGHGSMGAAAAAGRGNVRRTGDEHVLTSTGASTGRRDVGTTDLFIDTGVTYPSSAADLPDRSLPTSPPAGSVPIRRPLILSLLISAWLLFVNVWLFFGSLIVPIVLAVRGRRTHQVYMNQVYGFIAVFEKWLDAGEHRSPDDLTQALQLFNESVPEQYKPMYHQRWYIIMVEKAIEECLYEPEASVASQAADRWMATLSQIEPLLVTDSDTALRIRIALFRQELETALEDHLLSVEEESGLYTLIKTLQLDIESAIVPEIELIKSAALIRDEIQGPLEKLEDKTIPLVRGEVAYRVIAPVRLLNERIMSRFQRNNVVFRELGYELELEGKVVITDRRLIFVETTADTRTREFRINRVVDVIADPVRNLVEIVMSDRKSPVTVSSPSILVLSTVIERVQSESASVEEG